MRPNHPIFFACLLGLTSCSSAVETTGPLSTDAAPLALGRDHTCVVRADGALLCWGSNTFDKLGYATTTICSDAAGATYPPCNLAPGVVPNKKPPQIVVGWDHTCALSDAAQISCWGNDKYGQCGDHNHGEPPDRARASELTGVTQIAAAEELTCVVLSDGTARCFGFAHRGQLGDGKTSGWEVHEHLPVVVAGIDKIKSIAVGGWHACAIREDKSLWCWGDGTYGQLGFEAPDYCEGAHEAPGAPCSLAPQKVPGIEGVVDVDLGADHTCAVVEGGDVYCWGAGSFGQLGMGTLDAIKVPTRVEGLAPAIAIAAGTLHTCAIVEGGEVWCWGWNAKGQLGSAVEEQCMEGEASPCSKLPVAVPIVVGGVFLDAGTSHTCAVVGDGNMYCWGDNASGQLGDGTRAGRSEPKLVAFPAQ
jgi:alpha-tubulin suppressor-like RCC1 family protein